MSTPPPSTSSIFAPPPQPTSPPPSPAPPTTTISFPHFPHLPTELRLQIYKHSIQPRTIPLCTRHPTIVDHRTLLIGISNSSSTIPQVLTEEIFSTDAPTPVPALLHTCHESRHFGLRIYSLFFGTTTSTTTSGFPKDNNDDNDNANDNANANTSRPYGAPPQIYFSPEHDTVDFTFCWWAATTTGDRQQQQSPQPRRHRHHRRQLPVALMTAPDLARIRHIRADWCVAVTAPLMRDLARFQSLESFALSWFWRQRPGLDNNDPMCDSGPVEVVIDEEDGDGDGDRDRGDAATGSTTDMQSVSISEWERRGHLDIAQFLDAYRAAKQVWAPVGWRSPRVLRVKSLSNEQMADSFLEALSDVRGRRQQQQHSEGRCTGL